MIVRVLRGVLAGLAGTVVLSLLAGIETQLRGRAPVYEPDQMAGRLANRLLGRRLPRRQQVLVGNFMRWPYGASWGAGLGLFARTGRWPQQGIGLGAAVWLFELIALPLSGATPPLRKWEPEEVALDALNTLIYGAVTAGVFRGLGGPRAS